MKKCKACGRDFASTDPKEEICYPCKHALKRLNGYAVPVVRCKDCKHWNNPYCDHSESTMLDTQADDFCSYGERRVND